LIDTSLKDKYSQLFSLSKDNDITLKDACNMANYDIYNHFHLSLSTIASTQADELQEIVDPIRGQETKDTWNMKI
jgi:hypothetical protein